MYYYVREGYFTVLWIRLWHQCTPLSSNESDEGNNSGVKETPKGWNNTKPYKDTLEMSQFYSFYRMIAIFDVRQGSAKFYSPYKVL